MVHCSGTCRRGCNVDVSPMPLFGTSRPCRRAANVLHHATEGLLARHSRWYLPYSGQMLVLNKESPDKQKWRKLHLFTAAHSFDFVGIDILDHLTKTGGGNQNIVMITDWYCRLAKAILAAKMTARRTAIIFMEHCVANLVLPYTVQLETGPQFRFKFFTALCKELAVVTVATAEYHLQANGNVDRINVTMISRLRHYVAEHQSTGTWCYVLWRTHISHKSAAEISYPRSAWSSLNYRSDPHMEPSKYQQTTARCIHILPIVLVLFEKWAY